MPIELKSYVSNPPAHTLRGEEVKNLVVVDKLAELGGVVSGTIGKPLGDVLSLTLLDNGWVKVRARRGETVGEYLIRDGQICEPIPDQQKGKG